MDDHKGRFGVEPICRVLTEHAVPIAPSGYYAHHARTASARTRRDVVVLAEIERVFHDPKLGRGLYGARKVWHQLRREGGVDGVAVPRCQVERLMRSAGLRGVRRGQPVITTRADKAAIRPPDLVDRDFTAARPNQLWVVDFTYVPTWTGTVFTAFVSDVYSRRIVGWRTATSMPTELPLDALEMALWTRAQAGHDPAGVVHHSDAGTQPRLNRSWQHLDREVRCGARARLGRGSDGQAADAVTGSSTGRPQGASAIVLDGGLTRGNKYGCRARSRRVAGRW